MKVSLHRIRALAATAIFLAAPAWLAGQNPGSPVVKDFVSGGKIWMTLESGGYEIKPSPDNRIHVTWNEAHSKGVKVTVTPNGKWADLKVEGTPNHFNATIEVPATTDLRVRLTAGQLTVGEINGDKDIEGNAGDVIVKVGKSSDWSQVDASVTAGALNAPAFQADRGGLFRSFQWKGPGKHKLHVHLTAGNITLQ